MPSGWPMSRIHPPASGSPSGADPKHSARVRASHSGAPGAGQSASAHQATAVMRR